MNCMSPARLPLPNIRSFKAMKRPVDQWNDWLLYVLLEKLNKSSRSLWESSLVSRKMIPTYDELKDFLLTLALNAVELQTTP